MKKAWTKFVAWCASNTALAKCTRTIAQGIVGALVAYAADIIAGFGLDPTTATIITAGVMAILAPIQAAIGSKYVPEPTEE